MLNIRRPKRLFAPGAVTLLLSLASLAAWWRFVPIEYHFDATATASAATFGWTIPGNVITFSSLEARTGPRQRKVTVKLPNMQTYFEARASAIYFRTEGGRPASLTVQSMPLSRDAIIERARYWGKAWKIDITELETWHTARSGYLGPSAAGRFSKRAGDADIWLEVRTASLQADSWVLNLKIYWH